MTDRRTEIVYRREPKPGFFWRGLLIILPVAALAALGIFSLRQDRKLMENEVRERARAFADEAVERVWKRLASLTAEDLMDPAVGREAGSEPYSRVFQVAANGELAVPPPYPAVPPTHPRETSALDPGQAELWRRLTAPPETETPSASRITDLRAFLESNPPPEFAALAHYRLAMRLGSDDPERAAAECLLVINQFPQSTGETGLPLPPLAMMQLAAVSLPDRAGQPAEMRSLLNQLGSNAIAWPSVLTPLMLDQLAATEQPHLGTTLLAGHWRGIWTMDEQHRRMFRAALASLRQPMALSGPAAQTYPASSWPDLFWFPSHEPATAISQPVSGGEPGALWLAARYQSAENGAGSFIYRDLTQVRAILNELIPAEKGLPDYLGVYYQVAGRTVGGARWIGFAGGKAAATRLLTSAPAGVGRSGATGVALRLLTSAPTVESAPTVDLAPETIGRFALQAAGHHRSKTGTPLVTVGVSLLDPAALYARHRQRVAALGALIAGSALVALIGLFYTWSAFRQQQRLYEMQTNFVSSVTHELRAPIGAVRLMAENFQRGKVRDPAEQRQFFHYIVQECCRLSSMIENVLNLARIEQGRQAYEFEPTDVVRLVEDTVQLMEPSAADGQVVLKLELDRTPFANPNAEIILDGRAVQQALVNLIDNAIKHSPAPSVITVGAAWVNGPGPSAAPVAWLRLWVADQGPGIPAAEHQKIFERFYRLGSELRRTTPGVGIGLSIVKHITEAHHGRVWVESEPGQGSRFVLELPVMQSPTARRVP